MSKESRARKIEELKAKRAAIQAAHPEKFQKKERKPLSPRSFTPVAIDIALMLFCFATVVLAPLGLFFAVTAIFKYNLYKKANVEQENEEEPRD